MVSLCIRLAHEETVVSASLITHRSDPIPGYIAVLLGMSIYLVDGVPP